jgi:hypothetical protein
VIDPFLAVNQWRAMPELELPTVDGEQCGRIERVLAVSVWQIPPEVWAVVGLEVPADGIL